MKDVFDIDWVKRQLEFNMKYADGHNKDIFTDFGCDKLIKQALHEEFLQAFAPTLPPKAFNNVFININGYFYERFNLDDMSLKSLGLKDGNFVLEGNIKDYITEEGLLQNVYEKGILFKDCKLRFEKVKNLSVMNGLGENVVLTEPFKYAVDLVCGRFAYNIAQKIHKYTIYLKSVSGTKAGKKDILENMDEYIFQISFEYEDIDMYFGPAEALIEGNKNV